MERIPEEGILNSLRLSAEFVSRENPSVMPAWDARGCAQKAVPFKPDENGTMIWPLGACCIERDIAVRIEKYLRDARAGADARKGGKPRAEPRMEIPGNEDPEDLQGCLFMAPLTRAEREAVAKDSAMRRVGCRGVEEIFRLIGGRPSEEISE